MFKSQRYVLHIYHNTFESVYIILYCLYYSVTVTVFTVQRHNQYIMRVVRNNDNNNIIVGRTIYRFCVYYNNNNLIRGICVRIILYTDNNIHKVQLSFCAQAYTYIIIVIVITLYRFYNYYYDNNIRDSRVAKQIIFLQTSMLREYYISPLFGHPRFTLK